MKKILLLIAFFSMCFTISKAQINFKLGALAAVVQSEKNDEILNRFNKQNPEYIEGFGEMIFSYGLQGGLRYTTGPISWELTYQTLENKTHASGGFGTEAFVEKNLYYNYRHIDLGFEHKIMKVGYGATIGYSFLKVKSNTNVRTEKFKVLSDHVLNSQFFLSLHLAKTDVMEVVIRPYAEIAWDDYFMGDLENNINPNSGIVGTSLLDRVHMFGVSLIVYNGPQD